MTNGVVGVQRWVRLKRRHSQRVDHRGKIRRMVKIERPEGKRRRRNARNRWRWEKIRFASKAFGLILRRCRRGRLRVFHCTIVLQDERLTLFALRLLFDEFRRIEIDGVEFIGFGNGLRVVIVTEKTERR